MNKPSIGRFVHYYTHLGEIRPALILVVHSDDQVDLEVFGRPEGLNEGRFPTSVQQDESGKDTRTWRWPPRVG